MSAGSQGHHIMQYIVCNQCHCYQHARPSLLSWGVVGSLNAQTLNVAATVVKLEPLLAMRIHVPWLARAACS